jgi:phospholipid/cholesterol/gamma-HCH transport system substrate-binding protein
LSSFWTPIRVGLVVAASAAAFGLGLYFIGATSLAGPKTYLVYAVFEDATGLGPRSRAQIAGIAIGQVDHIELDQTVDKARVWLRIKKEFVLHEDATITKRSESILGDFLLDMTPGSHGARILKDGDEIRVVVKQPGLNEIMKSMSRIADDVSDVTSNLKKVFGSAEGEDNIRNIVSGLRRITDSLERTIDRSSGKLDAVLTNFQSFSGDLSRLSAGESQDIVAILQNTREATAEARDILKTIGNVIGSQNQGELKQSVSSVKSSLDKLDKTLANVQSVTDKVNRGEGTLGHLVNDDKLAKNLDRASTQLTNLLGTAESLKIEVFERTELLIGAPGGGTNDPNLPQILQTARNISYNPWAKNYFGIRIIPRPDKWYGFEIVDDPRGVTRRVQTVNSASCNFATCFPNFPDSLVQTTTERQLKFSVYLAKRYGPVSGRFGIIEDTGGFGLKLHLFNDSLNIALDMFEFANPLKSNPRVKLYADYRFLDHLFVTFGADDLVNRPRVDPTQQTRIISGRDFFIGGGLFFTDDDISKLIGLAVSRF